VKKPPFNEQVGIDAAGRHFVEVRGTGERIRVGKILGVGRNYSEHVREMGWSDATPPVLFLKPATAIVHDGGAVRIPPGVGETHHEVELVVAIGKPGRLIAEPEALEHVLGYAVGLDMTLRDVQAAAKAKGEPWAISKGFDTSAPVSTVAPRDEVGDGSGLCLVLIVNGSTRQEASTSSMIHGVPALVAFVSRFMTLERGDLIFTGTPAGVGAVHPGDLLEASLEKVGTLAVRVE
jgi:2-keto-4-pentenoate hydratase/2-oxohepta-3-ene-1,7-dioic acid hydratase in catechol pathway